MKNSAIKRILLTVPFLGATHRAMKNVAGFPAFVRDYRQFKRLAKQGASRFRLSAANWFPQLTDKTVTTPFDPHYTYHPAWAVRVLARTMPVEHVDVSSSLQFCAIVSAFIPVKFYDYRPATLNLSNLSSNKGDLMALPFSNDSVSSLSCMHTVEHVGLGRYGDQIDPEGDLKAIGELKRILAPGGNLLFVVPVGQPKLAFNAHRIYSYNQLIGHFEGLNLREFSLVPDNYLEKGIIYNADPKLVPAQKWGCGCFWFTKPK